MAFAIYRFEKLNDWGKVAAMGKHNERTRDTPNADPQRRYMNERLAGSGDWEADVRRVMDGAKIYKNSVLTYDLMLSASPKWFETASPDQIREWQRRSMDWIRGTFGEERIAAAIVHRDETTMHIQAAVVPVVEDQKRGRHLAASRWTDGKGKCTGLQTSYALAVADLGIERGIQGSQAKHQSQHRWYAQDQRRAERAQEIAGNPRAIQQELERRDAAELRATRAEATAKAQARTLDEQGRELGTLRRDYKGLADQVRQVDLPDVLQGMGATQDRHDRHMWRMDEHRINVDDTGHKFTDYNPATPGSGGGAIDLVQHVTGYTFRDSVDYLVQRHGSATARTAIYEHAAQHAARQVKDIEREPFTLPAQDGAAWPTVRDYLTRERRLPGDLVDKLYERGDVYAERSGHYINAVFVRRDEEGRATGASRRGLHNDFKGLARGSDREAGYFSLDMGDLSRYGSPALVLVESAIDAMSYAAEHPHMTGQIVSMDGSGEPPTKLIEDALERPWTVRGAFDKDAAGEALWEGIEKAFPAEAMGESGRHPLRRETPAHGKDWNEQLQRGGKGQEEGHDIGPDMFDMMGR